MSIRSLHIMFKSLAIILWLVFVITIVVLILNHSFWNTMPIIARNRVQNWLGWDLVFAIILSICSPVLKSMVKSK